jgi:hypothetical protein
VPSRQRPDDAQWREILDYFSDAIQIGMTATPRETKYISNINYFGEPVYTYSLRQGIEDGFLAPYKVIRIDIDKDIDGWTPPPGAIDDLGQAVPEREYNQADMDTILVLNQRTRLVARRILQYLNATDPFAKTIVFCEDIDHAERMRGEKGRQPSQLIGICSADRSRPACSKNAAAGQKFLLRRTNGSIGAPQMPPEVGRAALGRSFGNEGRQDGEACGRAAKSRASESTGRR